MICDKCTELPPEVPRKPTAINASGDLVSIPPGFCEICLRPLTRMSLNEVCNNSGCDKGTNGHNYAWLYELLFTHLPRDPRILEIGVFYGASLKAWLEYFPGSGVTGIDIKDWGCYVPGAKVIIADAYKPEIFFLLGDERFDIIIDDGSHNYADQKFVINHYSKFLTDTGILIIEENVVSAVENFPSLSYCTIKMGNARDPNSQLLIARRK